MIPVKLRLSGFLSYREPVELDFTSFDLACISGANGAGKSTLLDAITWAIFGEARRRDDSIINGQSTAAEVILDFLYENSLYRIQRSKTKDKATILEFLVQTEDGKWKVLTEHTLRETEERIRQTLRLDYETFTNASFFLQGKADQFATQRPGDRKRILASILGLEIWEQYRQQAADRRKLVELDKTSLEGILNEIQLELAQEDERRLKLAQLEETLQQTSVVRQAKESSLDSMRRLGASLAEQKRLVDMLSKQLDATRQRQQNRVTQREARSNERDIFTQQVARAKEIELGYQNWQQTRKELEGWDALAASFHKQEQARNKPLMAIESERARLTQEQANLQAEAGQVQSIEQQLPVMEQKLAELRDAALTLHARIEQRPLIEENLRQLGEDRSVLTGENNHLKIEMDALDLRIKKLNDISEAACPLCGQPLNPEDRARLINELSAQGTEMGNHYRRNKVEIQQIENQLIDLKKELDGFQKVEIAYRDQTRAADQMETQLKMNQQAIQGWQAAGQPRLDEVARALDNNTYAQDTRAELAAVDTGLKKLGYDAVLHDEMRAREQAGRAYEEEFRLLENARAALEPLERELHELEEHLSADQMELENQEKIWQEAAQKYEQESAALPDLNAAEAELLNLQETENRARMQVGGARQAVEVLKNQKKRLEELSIRRGELAQTSQRYKELERAFSKDGIPALLIEQALPEIEAQANEILDRLSNGNMSVRFNTQREYKDKNRDDRKETLDILISDPAGVREYELFSGGEAFRVNFAIRLALSRVLAQRAGARLQTLVIDEGFGSQDSEGRQRLIQSINLVRGDFAKILVITHLEELKDAFPTRIEVEKTPGGSRVTVVNA